jgi:hypothetical protein
MKRILIIIINYSLLIINSNAQEPTLSLQKAYELAQQNYPLIKQRELIKQTSEYSVDNLGKGFLPQIFFSGQATYQSEVTEPNLPGTPPGVIVQILDKGSIQIIGRCQSIDL